MDDLNAVTELMYGEGAPMLGYELSEEEAVAHVLEQFPNKPFCLVRNWIWIDLDVLDWVRVEIERKERQPVVLYAHQVVLDSRGRFLPGDRVRTTSLITFTDGCLFETANSVYVLLGHGLRKTAEILTVSNIF